MGHTAKKIPRATYADLEAVPPEKVAELIAGELFVFPRPAPRHSNATFQLGIQIGRPFGGHHDGPGGWLFLIEPELHFPDPSAPRGIDAVVPDLAGWRLERMPEVPETAAITLAPDWICEVLSPSTMGHDRKTKMPLYARQGVRFAWLIDPIERSLEVYALGEEGSWGEARRFLGVEPVRAVPFDAIELKLGLLWTR